jgi:hypothetical protein
VAFSKRKSLLADSGNGYLLNPVER